MRVYLPGRAAPALVEWPVEIARLPETMNGLRVLFASDVHVGGHFGEAALERLVSQMAKIPADLILWGGDYAETRAGQERFAAGIAYLSPRLGMLAVVGNNDWECFQGDYGAMRALFSRAGAGLLVNEARNFSAPGGRLRVIGVDDMRYGRPDAPEFSRPAEAGAARILLCHNPAALEPLLRDAKELPDLALCGHTHGGQISLFGLTPFDFFYEWGGPNRRRFFRVTGAHNLEGMRLLVSNGIGASKLPLRVGAEPQIHLLTLWKKIP